MVDPGGKETDLAVPLEYINRRAIDLMEEVESLVIERVGIISGL